MTLWGPESELLKAWPGMAVLALGARSPCKKVVPSSDQMTFYRIFVVRITSPRQICAFYATMTPHSPGAPSTVRGLRHARHPQFRSRGTLVATGSPDRTPRSSVVIP
jgi:hypothetical protein